MWEPDGGYEQIMVNVEEKWQMWEDPFECGGKRVTVILLTVLLIVHLLQGEYLT